MKLLTVASAMALAAIAPSVASAQQRPQVERVKSGYHQTLTSENSLLLLVDLQDMFGMTIASIGPTELVNNAAGVAKAAKVFGVPTIIASANARTFAGPVFQAVTEARPDIEVRDRTAINVWQDQAVVEEIRRSGRRKIIIGGLWTASCVMLPALSALGAGYEVYVLSDVTGDVSSDAQDRAMQRLVQAGATPVNWVALMLEWQGDWAKTDTAAKVIEIAKRHGGAWGLGASYAKTMNVGSEAR